MFEEKHNKSSWSSLFDLFILSLCSSDVCKMLLLQTEVNWSENDHHNQQNNKIITKKWRNSLIKPNKQDKKIKLKLFSSLIQTVTSQLWVFWVWKNAAWGGNRRTDGRRVWFNQNWEFLSVLSRLFTHFTSKNVSMLKKNRGILQRWEITPTRPHYTKKLR